MAQPPTITVQDGDDLITFEFSDVEKYHGQHSIGGAALGFQVMRAGVASLFPTSVPRREDVAIVTGHPGPGFRDSFELVFRAFTRGAYQADKSRTQGRYNPFHPHAYSWTVSASDGSAVDLVLKEGLIPHRFFELWDKVGRDEQTADEWQELVRVKRALADQVLARPLDELFDSTVRPAAAPAARPASAAVPA